jgi:hypothetical protein
MTPDAISAAEVSKGVEAFNSVYGEMDKALWRISQAARDGLLGRQESPAVGTLVWTIKSWWGVQGVRREVAQITAQALLAEEWTGELFEAVLASGPDAERFACLRVSRLVDEMVARGAGRREFSFASKTLHWLMPWRVPVYDSFVRKSVGVPTTWGHEDAYRQIVSRQLVAAEALVTGPTGWAGDVEPKSPLRALDKYLWWVGGGSTSQATLVKDPWSVVYRLGLRPE